MAKHCFSTETWIVTILVTICTFSFAQGRLIISPLIVGGVEARPGEYPWMVSIQMKVSNDKYMHSCGGTIVNYNQVITAAHCVSDSIKGDIRIVAGAHNIEQYEDSQQIVYPSRITRHANFNDVNALIFDIALMEVYPPFTQNDRVQYVQLPPDKIEATGMCQIVGWGQVNPDSIITSPVLRKAEVPVVPKSQCQSIYPADFHPETQMCAGRWEGGADTCNGDTGGALICNNTGYDYFAGIASWGWACAKPGKPGVYTDIPKFIGWINYPQFPDNLISD